MVVFPEPRNPLSIITEILPIIFVAFCFKFLMTYFLMSFKNNIS